MCFTAEILLVVITAPSTQGTGVRTRGIRPCFVSIDHPPPPRGEDRGRGFNIFFQKILVFSGFSNSQPAAHHEGAKGLTFPRLWKRGARGDLIESESKSIHRREHRAHRDQILF